MAYQARFSVVLIIECGAENLIKALAFHCLCVRLHCLFVSFADLRHSFWLFQLLKALTLTPGVTDTAFCIDLLVVLGLLEEIWVTFLQPNPIIENAFSSSTAG